MSPPATSKRRPRGQMSKQKPRPQPLVLDPSASRNLPGHLGACNSEHRRVTLQDGQPKSLFQVAAQGIREHHATAAYPTSRSYLHTTPAAKDTAADAVSAAVFARSTGVVQAGFLQKLGKNIPEFKRRFFVLKPETNLYYYLSPNETEPRGKINLEGSSIEQLEETQDGRLRFAVTLKTEHDGDDANNGHVDETKDDHFQQKQVVLEARSSEIGEEWIRHMTGERVSYLKDQNDNLTSTVTKQANQIADLERQIEHFRLIEADRDGALEDAKNWKNKFGRLDEALRLLTQQIRKSLSTSFTKEEETNDAAEEGTEDASSIGDDEQANSAQDGEPTTEKTPSPSSKDEKALDAAGTAPPKNNLAPSLLDDFVNEDMDVEEIMDVPGTYFSGLSNVCKQQKESWRLAAIEASSAVEDVLQANEKAEAIQKRMHKAEKKIVKLWEENCDVRKTLKQKKREKRVLVKEVKQLQQTVKELKQTIKDASRAPSKPVREDVPMEDSMIGSDEERLIIELEEHVASSIRLHGRLISGNDAEQSISTELASINHDAADAAANAGRSRVKHGELEASKTKLLSLFDDESDSEEESSVHPHDSEDVNSRVETQSLFGSVASSALSIADSDLRSPPRGNPLLELDEKEDSERSRSIKPSKLVTENGHATSRLVCPLADVVDVNGRSTTNDGPGDHKRNEDLRVHHLTFYSQKIGIQFQKAPPPPRKPRGLLNDALTADMVEEVDGSDKTAAELRSVASIASVASGGIDQQRINAKGSKSVPEDIVLVCGFEGFDDSGANQKPKLGARLVAFDGISVEHGKWNFDKIRKAIKSRGRPLTLSFRNDFLTTEQRETLTKAVKDVDAKRTPPVKRVLEYERPPSTTPSLTSVPSTESEDFLNPNPNNRSQVIHRSRDHANKILDISATATENSNCWNQFAHPHHSSKSSEAGSSRSVSSLMKMLVRKGSTSSDVQEGSESQLRSSKSQEESSSRRRNRMFHGGINPSGTQQHQDFQANLL